MHHLTNVSPVKLLFKSKSIRKVIDLLKIITCFQMYKDAGHSDTTLSNLVYLFTCLFTFLFASEMMIEVTRIKSEYDLGKCDHATNVEFFFFFF